MATQKGLFPPAVVTLCLLAPAVAAAQSDTGATRIGGLISTSSAGGSAPTFGISASYRFVPRLSAEADLSYFSDLTLAETPGVAAGAPVSIHAGTLVATFNGVFDVPTGGVRWLRPYVAAGAGVARVRRELQGLSGCRCEPRNDTRPVFSAGGGVDFPVGRGMALGLDFRYQRVNEDEQLFRPNLRNLKRIGSTFSYRL